MESRGDAEKMEDDGPKRRPFLTLRKRRRQKRNGQIQCEVVSVWGESMAGAVISIPCESFSRTLRHVHHSGAVILCAAIWSTSVSSSEDSLCAYARDLRNYFRNADRLKMAATGKHIIHIWCAASTGDYFAHLVDSASFGY